MTSKFHRMMAEERNKTLQELTTLNILPSDDQTLNVLELKDMVERGKRSKRKHRAPPLPKQQTTLPIQAPLEPYIPPTPSDELIRESKGLARLREAERMHNQANDYKRNEVFQKLAEANRLHEQLMADEHERLMRELSKLEMPATAQQHRTTHKQLDLAAESHELQLLREAAQLLGE